MIELVLPGSMVNSLELAYFKHTGVAGLKWDFYEWARHIHGIPLARNEEKLYVAVFESDAEMVEFKLAHL